MAARSRRRRKNLVHAEVGQGLVEYDEDYRLIASDTGRGRSGPSDAGSDLNREPSRPLRQGCLTRRGRSAESEE